MYLIYPVLLVVPIYTPTSSSHHFLGNMEFYLIGNSAKGGICFFVLMIIYVILINYYKQLEKGKT